MKCLRCDKQTNAQDSVIVVEDTQWGSIRKTYCNQCMKELDNKDEKMKLLEKWGRL